MPDYDYDDCASEDLLETGAFVNRGLDSDNLLSAEEEDEYHQVRILLAFKDVKFSWM